MAIVMSGDLSGVAIGAERQPTARYESASQLYTDTNFRSVPHSAWSPVRMLLNAVASGHEVHVVQNGGYTELAFDPQADRVDLRQLDRGTRQLWERIEGTGAYEGLTDAFQGHLVNVTRLKQTAARDGLSEIDMRYIEWFYWTTKADMERARVAEPGSLPTGLPGEAQYRSYATSALAGAREPGPGDFQAMVDQLVLRYSA